MPFFSFLALFFVPSLGFYADSFSASIMSVVIFAASGLVDDLLLYCAVALIHVTMHYGFLAEEVLRPVYDINTMRPKHWFKDGKNKISLYFGASWLDWLERLLPHLLGWVPYSTVWVCFLLNFIWNSNNSETGQSAPAFVWVILIGQASVFSCFGFVQLVLHAWSHGAKYYWMGEVIYICLSMAAKGLLGITLITSVIVYDSFTDAVAAAIESEASASR